MRPRRLYVKLYLAFLGVLLAISAASFLVLFLTSRPRPAPRPPYGMRLFFHLSRTLSGSNDGALRESLQGIHDDLDLEVVALDGRLQPRAAVGPGFPLPPPDLLERARKAPAWMPPRFGIVAGPLDGGVLVVRFPGVGMQRRHVRNLVFLVAGLLVSAALLWPLSRSITRPLERLTRTAEAFGKGDLSVRSGIERDDEVGQLARTFDEMAARTEAARRAERELLANVSHELRTPLARIQVALELLDARDEAARARVQAIRAEVEELGRLVGDVLANARLELSALPLQKHELPLRTFLEQARQRALALDPGRDIELDVPEGLAVQADEALLARLLDNLIDNARKYDAAGGAIRVEARREGGGVAIAVQDAGPGIPEADLAKIFEPFFRGGNARASTPGFGLGLALARRVAQAHGGSIKAANAPGRGARIEITLPA